MRTLLILCLALGAASASAQTYRWVDANGRTVFSDTPPPGTTKTVSKTSDKATPDDGLPFAVKKAAEAFPVTLFTTPDCVDECKQARSLLNGRGVPFTERMVVKPDEVAELKQLVGDAFVPSLRVGKQSARGFESTAYNNLLDLAGYPKTAPYGAKPAAVPGQ